MFYGESYRIATATTIAGGEVTRDALRYHFDGLSCTVSAGDSFMVGADGDMTGLTATDEAVISWVVETGPGSAGTFTVASGLDADYTGTDLSDATQPLGTFTVAGGQTIVAGPTSITVADLFAFEQLPVALVTVTSGTVEVRQVKLRVWPPSGAAGAWVTGPEYVRVEGTVDRWYASINEGTPQVPTYAEAWEAQKGVIATWDGRPDTQYGPAYDGQALFSFFYVTGNPFTPPFTPSGSGASSIALLSARPFGATPSPDLDTGIDPNEVRQEVRSFIRGVGGGEATVSFLGWEPDAAVTVDTPTYVGAIDLGGSPELSVDPDDAVFRRGPFHQPGSFTLATSDVPLSTLGGQHVALAVMASLYFTGPPTGDTTTTASADVTASTPYRTLVGNYEWFSPAATPTLDPRFFVVFEGEDRAVGFGKPATEVAVFGVQTALGNYRDLTFDEYASADGPLPDFTP